MKKKILLSVAVVCLLLLTGWLWWGNTTLEVNEYEIKSDRIPQGFSGFRIAQVSDLHNAEFGEDNSRLLQLLEESTPDIIVITGDLVDSRNTDLDIAVSFAEKAADIAPVYYISGNHEARISQYPELKDRLKAAGVTVLENQRLSLTRGADQITLMGLEDPSFSTDYLFGDAAAVISAALRDLQCDCDCYTVLLSHRPELFEVYVDAGIDLVFSGHAHGGQVRLPFLGGLAAPNQGFFPEYDAGQFTESGTTMIVSRGIGNSIIPLRINNPPEIVVAELVNP